MSEEFEAPPIGGENVPFKELQSEKPPSEGQIIVKKSKNLNFLWVFIVVIAIFLGIIVGMNFKPKNKTIAVPSLSPPVPSPSLLPSPLPKHQEIKDKLENFQKNLDSINLNDSEFRPPALDYKIRFKAPK